MGKINNLRFLWVILIIAFGVLLSIFIFNSFNVAEIMAEVSPTNITTGEKITFTDSTTSSKEWLWEFGNGDFSEQQKGTYVFQSSGKYQIRLTVDGKSEKTFIVNVVTKSLQNDTKLVSIDAPVSAMQGEYIVFRGIGEDKQWRWEFGESGMVDARDKSPIYAYKEPGVYEVLLSTENTQYPIRHTIKIKPKYIEDDTTDVMTRVGGDIKEKLQNIIDGKPFNTNYNYILNQYLCGNSSTVVAINNNKLNDFYSYCQGLRLIGKDLVIIENVIVERQEKRPEDTKNCINKIIVMQSEATKP